MTDALAESVVIQKIAEKGFGEAKRVIHTVTLLYEGWEMDNEAWVVEMADGGVKAFSTSHGFMWSEMSAHDLAEKLTEAQHSANQITEALRLIGAA